MEIWSGEFGRVGEREALVLLKFGQPLLNLKYEKNETFCLHNKGQEVARYCSVVDYSSISAIICALSKD